MISITSYRDEELTIIKIEPFAWMMWPMEIAMLALDTIRTSVEMANSDRSIVLDHFYTKEVFIPKRGRGNGDRHNITRTTTLPPVVHLTHYEDREDYLAAKSAFRNA